MSNAQILIIDDDDAFADFLKSLFESVGYAVRAERQGRAAVAYAAGNHPDLVMLDAELSDVGADHVCLELRNGCGVMTMPVVLLTNTNHPVTRRGRSLYGADASLGRWCGPIDILNAVRLLLR